MKSEMRVTLGQIPVDQLDPEANADRIDQVLLMAASEGSDLVVLPELSDVGQVPGFDAGFAARYAATARPIGANVVVEVVRRRALEAGLHVVVGVAEAHDVGSTTLHNSAVLVGPSGEVLGVQRKLHLPGAERHYFGVGDEIVVTDTAIGRIAMAICYDLYFPEVARVSALKGAEILVGPANIPHRPSWPERLTSLARVRAYENMHHVVIVNRVGANHGVTFGGESVAASPPGIVAASLPTTTAVETTTLTAETLTRERLRRPVFADRRPGLYGSLTELPAPHNDGGTHGR